MFALGRPSPAVMEQLGHTDARLTLRVYTRAMCQSPQERDLRKALFDGLIGAPTGSRAGFFSADASHGTAPKEKPPNNRGFSYWARLVSNQRPLACEAIPHPTRKRPFCLQNGSWSLHA